MIWRNFSGVVTSARPIILRSDASRSMRSSSRNGTSSSTNVSSASSMRSISGVTLRPTAWTRLTWSWSEVISASCAASRSRICWL